LPPAQVATSFYNFSDCSTYNHITTVLWPFFWEHPEEPVPQENFWTLWCKRRLTKVDTPTIRLGTTPSGLTSAHLHPPPFLTVQLRHVTREQQPPTFWPMSIVVKQLDGSTCHLVCTMEVRVGPDHVVSDGNPAPP